MNKYQNKIKVLTRSKLKEDYKKLVKKHGDLGDLMKTAMFEHERSFFINMEDPKIEAYLDAADKMIKTYEVTRKEIKKELKKKVQ